MNSFMINNYKNSSSKDLNKIIKIKRVGNILFNEKTPIIKKYVSKFNLPIIKTKIQKSIFKDHPQNKSIKFFNPKININEVNDNINKSLLNNNSELKINHMISGCFDITKINPPNIPNKCKKNSLDNELLKKISSNKIHLRKNKIQELILNQKVYNINKKYRNHFPKNKLKIDSITSTHGLYKNIFDINLHKKNNNENIIKHFDCKTNENNFIKDKKLNTNQSNDNYKTIRIIKTKNRNDDNKDIDKNIFVDYSIALDTSYIIGKAFSFVSDPNKK